MINFVSSTTKRPVPLEHCIFYSGEFYKICENEMFLPQGLKSAKDSFRKKNMTNTGGNSGSGPYMGNSVSTDSSRVQKHETTSRNKQHKHSSVKLTGTLSGGGGGRLNNGHGQSNWGTKRNDASTWITLINKLSKKSFLPVRCNFSLAFHILSVSLIQQKVFESNYLLREKESLQRLGNKVVNMYIINDIQGPNSISPHL